MEQSQDHPGRRCQHCCTALTDETAGGLCPRCLLEMNFASRTMPGGEPSPKIPPPSPEEMAARFPQFEILECLGRGGMGIVYKARQKTLDRLVAIKVLAGERRDDPLFEAHFSREARTLAKLSHPNIVTVHDFGESDGMFYLVMEFVDGVNLRDILRDGRMEPAQALAIVPEICAALQFAHDQGVVHRDIKPENILMDRNGRVKIADFGIAALVGADADHSGTPPYMAPEQEAGKGSVDNRADIYALGVVFYEMLTGERPEQDPSQPSRRVEIDVRLDEIVLRALEKEPARRYQTAGEFRTVVETMVASPTAPTSTAQVQPKGLWAALKAGKPEAEWEGRAPGWRIRCRSCGFIEHFGKYGIRMAAAGTKWTLGRCQRCRRIRVHVIEKGPVPVGQARPDPAPHPVKSESATMETREEKITSESQETVSSPTTDRDVLHGRMLIYGFVTSIFGLPIGILLKQPVVWGLAILGIVVGGIKLGLRRNHHDLQRSSRRDSVRRGVLIGAWGMLVLIAILPLDAPPWQKALLALFVSSAVAVVYVLGVWLGATNRTGDDDGESKIRTESPGTSETPPTSRRAYNPWEPVSLVAGTVIFLSILAFAWEWDGPFRMILLILGVFGLWICALSFAGYWPFRSPLFPEPNFSSRNLRRRWAPVMMGIKLTVIIAAGLGLILEARRTTDNTPEEVLRDFMGSAYTPEEVLRDFMKSAYSGDVEGALSLVGGSLGQTPEAVAESIRSQQVVSGEDQRAPEPIDWHKEGTYAATRFDPRPEEGSAIRMFLILEQFPESWKVVGMGASRRGSSLVDNLRTFKEFRSVDRSSRDTVAHAFIKAVGKQDFELAAMLAWRPMSIVPDSLAREFAGTYGKVSGGVFAAPLSWIEEGPDALTRGAFFGDKSETMSCLALRRAEGIWRVVWAGASPSGNSLADDLRRFRDEQIVGSITVQDLALRFLVAIREKDVETLRDLCVDRTKGWTEALVGHFSMETREMFRKLTGEEFAMYPDPSAVRIDGDLAVVVCRAFRDVQKKLNGNILVLYFCRTETGWKVWTIRNAPESQPIKEHLDQARRWKAEWKDPGTGSDEAGAVDVTDPAVETVQLPDADRKDVPVVLDLATGELLGVPLEGAQEIIHHFDKLGKGDLAWDRALITLRGARVHEWSDGVWKLLAAKREDDGCAHYRSFDLPRPLLVTTAEGDRYAVEVSAGADDGVIIRYYRNDVEASPKAMDAK